LAKILQFAKAINKKKQNDDISDFVKVIDFMAIDAIVGDWV
jgi:hypothetical protein